MAKQVSWQYMSKQVNSPARRVGDHLLSASRLLPQDDNAGRIGSKSFILKLLDRSD
ncbi:MAG: hypothetical protein HQ515_04800 [Phycisphaeraceae bacterium]|nr:hypothetical protein [Phycisphaeraceae bacterium]